MTDEAPYNPLDYKNLTVNKPVWNVCIEGFGLHDPGGGRRKGEISWWDALHPGRSWAKKQKQTKTTVQVITRLSAFLSGAFVEFESEENAQDDT